MPKFTFENINAIKEHIINNYHIRFNEITQKYEISTIPITERQLNDMYIDICRTFGSMSKTIFRSILYSSFIEPYNPFFEFFRENRDPSKSGFIKKCSDCIDTDGDQELKSYNYYFFKKWFVGMVASMLQMDYSELILVLYSEEQGTGKTHFLRHILPPYFNNYVINKPITNDSDKDFLQFLTNSILIIDDEFSGSGVKNKKIIKKLLSLNKIDYRKPFAEMPITLSRLATFAGATNEPDIINDVYNRRIIPLHFCSYDQEKFNNVCKISMLQEAYNLLQNKFNYKILDKDIVYLNKYTNEYTTKTKGEMYILSKYSSLFSPKTMEYTHVEVEQLISEVFHATGEYMSPKRIGTIMAKNNFKSFRKKTGRRYFTGYKVFVKKTT